MLRRAVFASIVVAAFACGPSNAPGDGNTGPIGIDDLPSAIATNYCAVLVRCGVFGDATFCASSFGAQITNDKSFNSLGAAVAAVKADKVTYDGTAARTCVNNLGQLSCDTFQFNGFAEIPGCAAVFTGTFTTGQSCIADQECQTGSFCKETSASASCPGTCTEGGTQCHDSTQCLSGKVCEAQSSSAGACVTPKPAGGVSQACGTNDACQSGLYCDTAASSPVCKERGKLGEPCLGGFAGSCVSGLICVLRESGGGATCLPSKAKGQDCEAAAQCGGTFSTLVCDISSHKCVTRPTSGPCVSGSYFGCDLRTSYCDFSSRNAPTCKPYKSAGASCDTTKTECGLGLFEAPNSCVATGSGTTGTCKGPGTAPVCSP